MELKDYSNHGKGSGSFNDIKEQAALAVVLDGKIKRAIELLGREADRLDSLAVSTKDKFNKGFFEGRAEQSRRLSEALESESFFDSHILDD